MAKAGGNPHYAHTFAGNGPCSIVERAVMLQFDIFELVCIFLNNDKEKDHCQISIGYRHETIAPMSFIGKTKILQRLRTTTDEVLDSA